MRPNPTNLVKPRWFRVFWYCGWTLEIFLLPWWWPNNNQIAGQVLLVMFVTVILPFALLSVRSYLETLTLRKYAIIAEVPFPLVVRNPFCAIILDCDDLGPASGRRSAPARKIAYAQIRQVGVTYGNRSRAINGISVSERDEEYYPVGMEPIWIPNPALISDRPLRSILWLLREKAPQASFSEEALKELEKLQD